MGDFLKNLNSEGLMKFASFMRNDGKLDQAEKDTLSQAKYQIQKYGGFEGENSKKLDEAEATKLEAQFSMAATDENRGLKVEHTKKVDGVRQVVSEEEYLKEHPDEISFWEHPIDWVMENPKTTALAIGSIAAIGVGGWALVAGKLAASKATVPMLLGVLGLTSCSKDDSDDNHTDGHGNTIINQIVTININVGDTKALETALDKITLILSAMSMDLSDVKNSAQTLATELAQTKALLVQIIEQQAKTAEDIIELCGQNNDLLRIVIEQLIEGNSLLADIKTSIDNGNAQSVENTQAILKAIMEVKNAVDTVNKSIQGLPEGIAKELGPKLQEILIEIQKNGATLEDIKGLLADLQKLIQEKVIPNQDLNNEQNADVINLLKAILAVDVNNGDALVKILQQLKEIGSDLKAIKNGITKLLGQNDKILAYLDKIEKNQQKGAEILQAISQTMLKIKGQLGELSEAQKGYFEKLLKAISENTDAVNANGTKLDDMLALLNLININVVEGNQYQKQQIEAADKILAKLNELDFNVAAGMGNIVAAVLQSGDKINANVDKVVDLLGKIKTAVVQGNKNAVTMGNQLMTLLGNIGISMIDGMDKIYDALLKGNDDLKGLLNKINSNIELQQKISSTAAEKAQEQAAVIIQLIEQLGVDMAAGLSELYSEAVKGNVNLEEIKNQLKSLNDKMDKLSEDQKQYFSTMIANTIKNGEKLDGIVSMINIVNQTVASGNQQQIAKLDEILKAISKLNTAVIDGTDKIVKAVANNTLSVEKATKMIESVAKAVDKVGDKVDANGKTADENAKAIMEKLDKIGFVMFDGFEALLEQAAKGNVTLADIRSLLEKIDGSVGKLSENQKTYFAKMLAKAAENGTKLDNIAQLIRVVDTDMMTANAEQKAKLDEILKAINNTNLSVIGGTDKIVNAVMDAKISVDEAVSLLKDLSKLVGDIGTTVDHNGKTADENAKAILQYLASMNFSMRNGFEALIEAADKASGQRQEILAAIKDMAGKIQNSVDKLSAQQKEYFDKMLAQAIKNGDKLDNIKAKLDSIADLIKVVNNSVNSADSNRKAEAQAILDKIEAMQFKFVEGADKIVQAIVSNKVDLQPVIDLLNQLNTASNKSIQIQTDILAKLGEFGDKIKDVTPQLTAILNAVNNNGEIGKGLATLLNKILEKMDKMDNTNKQGFVDVINAIKDLSNVISNMNIPGGKDYEQYLKDILAKLDAGNVSVGALKVEIEGLKALLTTINNNVIKNNDTNEKILKVVEELGAKMAGGFNAVVNAFKDGNAAQLAKLDAILNKLDNMDKNRQKEAADILAAIKDHDVKVTVDVTGKVTCTCNCQCNNTGGTTHEGIVGDLEDLLND